MCSFTFLLPYIHVIICKLKLYHLFIYSIIEVQVINECQQIFRKYFLILTFRMYIIKLFQISIFICHIAAITTYIGTWKLCNFNGALELLQHNYLSDWCPCSFDYRMLQQQVEDFSWIPLFFLYVLCNFRCSCCARAIIAQLLIRFTSVFCLIDRSIALAKTLRFHISCADLQFKFDRLNINTHIKKYRDFCTMNSLKVIVASTFG